MRAFTSNHEAALFYARAYNPRQKPDGIVAARSLNAGRLGRLRPIYERRFSFAVIVPLGTRSAGWHCHTAWRATPRSSLVSRTLISNADLTYKFEQMLKTIGDCPPTVPVAIVPDEKGGWSAVISARLRREYPDCVDRIQAIERQLRGTYVLDGD
jgi:hypothetical protein